MADNRDECWCRELEQFIRTDGGIERSDVLLAVLRA